MSPGIEPQELGMSTRCVQDMPSASCNHWT